MTFRLLLNDPKNYTENLPKLRPKTYQNLPKSVLIATETQSRKQIAKTYPKISQKLENGPPNADPKVGQFLTTGRFYLT